MHKAWSKDFLGALEQRSDQISKLVESNLHFRVILEQEPLVYRIPEGHNEIKMKFLNKMGSFTPDDVYQVFCDFIANGIYKTWQDKLIDWHEIHSSYVDLVVRKVMQDPTGDGIAYLCLSVAGEVDLTETLLSEIAISKRLCPILPFREEETRALLEVVGTDDRLRLGLMICHTLGKLCSNLKIKFTAEGFVQGFRELLYRSTESEVNFLISTLTNRRNPTFISSPPPSPIERSVDLIRPEIDWITGRPFF